MRKIRTLLGNEMTVSLYLALANINKKPCEHGHFSCAAWEGGPCADKLLAQREQDETDSNEGETLSRSKTSQ